MYQNRAPAILPDCQRLRELQDMPSQLTCPLNCWSRAASNRRQDETSVILGKSPHTKSDCLLSILPFSSGLCVHILPCSPSCYSVTSSLGIRPNCQTGFCSFLPFSLSYLSQENTCIMFLFVHPAIVMQVGARPTCLKRICTLQRIRVQRSDSEATRKSGELVIMIPDTLSMQD